MKGISILFCFFVLSCSSSQKEDAIDTYSLTVEFENVDGLETNAAVLYKGMKKGKVTDMEISKNNFINVTMQFSNDFKIPKNSDFTIFSSNMMGERAINLEFSTNKEFYTLSDKIKGKNQKTIGESVEEEMSGPKALMEQLYQSKVLQVTNNDSVFIIKIRKDKIDDTNTINFINKILPKSNN